MRMWLSRRVGARGMRRAYRRALRQGDEALAENLARRIVELDPSDAALWFDLALAAKRRRDWPAAVELNERALDASGGEAEDPAAWNLGIAATAMGDWARARRAWATFGLPMPQGDRPVVMTRLGTVPVRLNPSETELGEQPLALDGVVHDPEVVWAERLSPAHARIVNVPSPTSGHRWGDVVLTDGVPHGERHDGYEWVPVFDELERLEHSPHVTWSLDVIAPGPGDSEALVRLVEASGLAAEDWTTSIRQLCVACSTGRPGAHDHDAPTTWEPARRFGLAGGREVLADVLIAWGSAAPGRSWGELVEAPAR